MTTNRFHSPGNVPFSWENSPGISKVAPSSDADGTKIELPPPPCTDVDMPRRRSVQARHSIHVPLPLPPPPVPFQPTGSSARHAVALRGDEDPFLAAYMECTKSMKKKEGRRPGSCNSRKERVKRPSSGSSSWGLSCKQGSGVREDGIVRMSTQAHVREKSPSQ